ncbi:hypothetical protein HN020_11345 [Brevibacillus borstelensis]|uniref:hypothetical protein n=1 Tax=Brevibacillus borstelensis TaxID=45462 RepID=UPI0014907E9A|nr:hypothetical protein [Brevibacillus borstelensis]MCM3625620.1 hypothetical protein [Brevibacillus borstelensis]NOU55343.1 hypothetical protein [Brevibacillus borstelensis]
MKKIILSLTMVLAVSITPLAVSAKTNESPISQTAIKGSETINIKHKTGMGYEAKNSSSKSEVDPLSSVEGEFGYSALWWMESDEGLLWEVDPVFPDPYEMEMRITIYSQDTGKTVKTIYIDGYGIGRETGIEYYPSLPRGEYYAELSGDLEFIHGTAHIGDGRMLPGTSFVVR